MSRPATAQVATPALTFVQAPEPAAPTRDAKAQLRRTRALARAIARFDRHEAAMRAAKAEVDAAFAPWAAGRRIGLDDAREQLTSTGFLPRRRVWE